MKSRKVLTIDQVFSIIGEVASNGKTWTDAIMKILPSRKEAMQISAEVEESKAENVDEVQKEIQTTLQARNFEKVQTQKTREIK